MKPWIDPRERRARWYFSALMVISAGALIAAIFLLMFTGPTSEEVAILIAAVAGLAIVLVLGVRQLRGLSREFQQYEEPNETSGDPG